MQQSWNWHQKAFEGTAIKYVGSKTHINISEMFHILDCMRMCLSKSKDSRPVGRCYFSFRRQQLVFKGHNDNE